MIKLYLGFSTFQGGHQPYRLKVSLPAVSYKTSVSRVQATSADIGTNVSTYFYNRGLKAGNGAFEMRSQGPHLGSNLSIKMSRPPCLN